MAFDYQMLRRPDGPVRLPLRVGDKILCVCGAVHRVIAIDPPMVDCHVSAQPFAVHFPGFVIEEIHRVG